ncbi:MAG: TRAP transporter small permease subunit, partial [Pseudomonadota bacterium]
WMHAAVFMLGAAHTLQHDEHVRVDVFYRSMSERRRAVVDLFGVLAFLWPMCAFLAWTAWDFVAVSWSIGEASREAGGLPYPWIPMLKTVLVLMPLTVALQGLSIVLRSLRQLAVAR